MSSVPFLKRTATLVTQASLAACLVLGTVHCQAPTPEPSSASNEASPTDQAPQQAPLAAPSESVDSELAAVELPGPPPAADPLLMKKAAKRLASADDWTTEGIADQAGSQLKALGKLLEHPSEIGPEALAGLADRDYSSPPLRPPSLASTELESGLRVKRGSPAPTAEGATLKGRAGLADGLRSLADALGDDGAAHTKFQVVRIDREGDRVRTAVILLADSQGDGSTQINANWSCTWKLGDAASAPLLMAIETESYEEVHSEQETLFSECTRSVLGDNPSWESQIRPSLDSWRSRLDRSLGVRIYGHSGLAVGDADGDGLDDLFLCQGPGLPDRLYLQQEDGSAKDVSAEAGVDSLDGSRSALFLDLDDDGDQDLLVAVKGHIVVHANDGQARFSIIGSMDAPAVHSLAAADFDRDGDLDIYATAYKSPEDGLPPLPYHDAVNGSPNSMFRNEGEFRFSDITESSGLGHDNHGFSFAASWEDYDEDGDVDLYVANDFGRNKLYRNDGESFTEVAAEAGVEDLASGMGVTWTDVDQDGDFDLYVSNMFSSAGGRIAHQRRFQADAPSGSRENYQRLARGNTLFRNNGDGTFSDDSESAGVTMGRWAWGALALDMNNDGLEDLVVPNGFITNSRTHDLSSFFWRQVVSHSPDVSGKSGSAEYTEGWAAVNRMIREGESWSGRELNCAFLNTGDGRFADVSAPSGLSFDDDARAVAVTDWDLDGDLDLWIANRTSPRLRFMRNDTTPGKRFLALRLRTTKGNRDAIGARAELSVSGPDGERVLVRALRAGEGYLAQSSKWLHFGLGETGSIDSLTLRWPDGSRETFAGLERGGRYLLEQGSGRAEPWSVDRGELRLEAAITRRLPSPGAARAVLSSRPPMPEFEVLGFAGAAASLQNLRGKPYLLNLWASWCQACRKELGELAEKTPALAEAGLSVVTLNLDEAEAREKASAFLSDLDADFLNLVGTREAADVLDVLQRTVLDERTRIALPTSFLVDGEGKIVVLYRGIVAPDQLLEDVSLLELNPKKLREASVAFPGRWYSGPPHAPVDELARAFTEAGYGDVAASLLRSEQDASDATVASVQLQIAKDLLRQDRKREANAALEIAVTAYRKLLERKPDDPVSHNNLGIALTMGGRCDLAVPHFLSAATDHPAAALVQSNLGRCLDTLGHHQDALAALREAARLDPKNPQHQQRLAQYERLLAQQP